MNAGRKTKRLSELSTLRIIKTFHRIENGKIEIILTESLKCVSCGGCWCFSTIFFATINYFVLRTRCTYTLWPFREQSSAIIHCSLLDGNSDNWHDLLPTSLVKFFFGIFNPYSVVSSTRTRHIIAVSYETSLSSRERRAGKMAAKGQRKNTRASAQTHKPKASVAVTLLRWGYFVTFLTRRQLRFSD